MRLTAAKQRLLWAAAAACVGVAALSVWAVAAAQRRETQRPAKRRVALATIRKAVETLKPLHQEKTPGDWMARNPDEKGQSFNQYRRERPDALTAKYGHLYVQPLGEYTPAQRELVRVTEDYLSRLFGLPVAELDPLGADAVPESARRLHPEWGDRQVLTTYVLHDLLPERRKDDALAVLALTAEDLYPDDDWNFVFGQASLSERVGVWSMYRYGDPTESDEARQKCLLRMLKVAGHETGHMLGIPHCTAWECNMNGSNSLPETDAQPLAFCHECAAKIWWAMDLRSADWYESLAEFAREQGLQQEAAAWQQCLERLEKAK